MTFIKKVEDFICEKCDNKVRGDGYTNHCPNCLWSKHVDDSPGDRAALSRCGGLMEPTDFIKEGSETVIVHKCKKCGHVKHNKMHSLDDFNVAVEIMKSKNN